MSKTNECRVQERYPHSTLEHFAESYFVTNYSAVGVTNLGQGTNPEEAWADAERRTRGPSEAGPAFDIFVQLCPYQSEDEHDALLHELDKWLAARGAVMGRAKELARVEGVWAPKAQP